MVTNLGGWMHRQYVSALSIAKRALYRLLIPSKGHNPEDPYPGADEVDKWLARIPTTDLKKIDYLYSEIGSKVSYELECVDALDAKAGVAVALIGTLLTIVGAVTASTSKVYFKAFSTASVVLLIVAGIYAVLAFFPRSWGKAPQPSGLLAACSNNETEIVKKRVISRWLWEFKKNKETICHKRSCFNFALVYLLSGVAVLGFGIIAKFWFK